MKKENLVLLLARKVFELHYLSIELVKFLFPAVYFAPVISLEDKVQHVS